jgi:non-canonical purine NTP pyrophosphatase (RdgB/HAM1 family)
MMGPFVFVTQSPSKIAEAERILGFRLESRSVDLEEIQELDVERVVERKAITAYHLLGERGVLVEDTGLYLDAWDRLPGALIKWFVRSVGPEGLCRMLEGFHPREATAETVLATYDGQLRTYRGAVRGRIADKPAGVHGFGWDSIFIPDGSQLTFAEMSPAEKDRFSMRRIAFEAMASTL